MENEKKIFISKRTTDLLNLLAAKIGFMGALYLGATYHQPILRSIDRLVYGSAPIQEEFFQDPHGLRIETENNIYGKKEVFLVYENRIFIPLTYQNISNLEKKVIHDKHFTSRGALPIPIKR